MGVTGLAKLISHFSPNAVCTDNDLKDYSGKAVAMDASMCLYQALTAIGAQLSYPNGIPGHLIGTFYTNIRLLENGVKPVYVFDGLPPNMKSGKLEMRAERRENAWLQMKEAESRGDMKAMCKFNRRMIKVNGKHVRESKELLKLMGIPYVEAPGEAEAQCAALVRAGKVYATATEDMDALTFGSNVLLRHFNFRASRNIPIQEIQLDKVLTDLQLNLSEFIDLSIILGCDYCRDISRVGPKRAIQLIQKYRKIEAILENIDRKKFKVPENWMYEEARQLFVNPIVTDCDRVKLIWRRPDIDGIVNYLCRERNFNQERVRRGVTRLSNLW